MQNSSFTHSSAQAENPVRHDWSREEVSALLAQPFMELMFQAQSIHRQHFDPSHIQMSTLLSIKTGACPEDCKYCPQSGHYNTGLEKEKLLAVRKVIEEAEAALKVNPSSLEALSALAAVRLALTIDPSRIATGRPVRAELRMTTADALSTEAAEVFDRVKKAKGTPVADELIKLASDVIARKKEKFDPSAFQDHYQEALHEFVKRKQAGRKPAAPQAKQGSTPSNVVNLFDALKKSLGEDKAKKAPAKKEPAKRTAAKKEPARKRA